MALQTVSVSFPDSTYSSSNKPSSATLKADIATLETAVNDHAANAADQTSSQTLTSKTLTSPVLNGSLSGTAFLDEDDMTSNSATKVASQQSIKAYVDAAILAAKQALYPVGSLYVNYSSSTNPGTLLGFGTWVAASAGKVPVGIDAGQTEFDTAGETGGAKTHSITTAELPPHYHGEQSGTIYGSTTTTQLASSTGANEIVLRAGASEKKNVNQSVGSGDAMSLLQPYEVYYMWRRTA